MRRATLPIALAVLLLHTPPARAALAPLDPGRVRQIAAWLPEHATGVGPRITDRAAWGRAAKATPFTDVIDRATKVAAEPIPAQPDDLYLVFSKTGDRDQWQGVAFDRRGKFATLVLAECAEDKGRFLPKIAEYVDALCAERTWVWPAHDRGLDNFNGKTTGIDLGASELGWNMANARWLLAERLPEATREKIRENVDRRIVRPYLAAATEKAAPFGWQTVTNNWNAVCHAGVTGAILATADDKADRATAVASAERSNAYFLAGFPKDGYCSEGLGYWNYGFGRFAVLAETVYQATGGKVDFMADPKARQPATFGARIQITGGVAPAFADCPVDAKPYPQLMWYANHRFGLGLPAYDALAVAYEDTGLKASRNFLSEALVYRFLDAKSLAARPGERHEIDAAGPRTYFADAGVLIGRPGPGRPECELAVALKGGHNAEHHNHNDLGSYVVVVAGRAVLLDPGIERYTARTFSGKRYVSNLLNSYGHPVPVVAGQLQKEGAQHRARVVKAEFGEEQDVFVLDLKAGYDVPDLQTLERTFVYSRAGAGSLTVTDRVAFKTPQAFGSALVTAGKHARRGDGTIVVTDGPASVEVRLTAAGGTVGVRAEEIKENAPVKPTRIGVDFDEPVKDATLTMTITAR